MPRLLSSLSAIVGLLLWFSAPAHAQQELAETYAWTMPSPEQQLAADETIIPVGKGAVFVPSITGPEHEPPAAIVTEDDVISIPTGQRVLLDPGPYVVVISSGSPAQGLSVAVDIKEGETTLLPVTWGALRIEVTDDRRIPHRGSYEIIRADTRDVVGTGFGVDTLQGEILQTWLLPPGLYRIVKTGRNFRALRDFSTVYVPEAGFVRYRLVQDEETGDFLGAGVLLPEEFGSGGRENTRWFRSLVIGVDGSVVSRQNAVAAFNGTELSAAGYVDLQLAFQDDPHRFSLLLQAEEGASQLQPEETDPLPVVKSTDELRGDLLYTLSLRGSTGPYVRGSAESNAFRTDLLVTEDTTFVTQLDNGTQRRTTIPANDTFVLADAWAPTILREGVGINTSFLQKNRSMNFNFRIGFGMRQNFYEGSRSIEDASGTDEVEYDEEDSFFEEGIEATVVASLRLPGWVVYSTDLELFSDFQTFDQPAASWRNTLSVRITRNLSLNYTANVDLEPQVVEKAQTAQSLLVRASWSVF